MNRSAGYRAAAAVLGSLALLGSSLPALADPASGSIAPVADDAAVVAPAVEAPAAPAPMRVGEVLMKPAAGSATVTARALLAVGGRTTGYRRGGWQEVTVPVGREHAAALRLAADPAVAAAVPNYLRTAASHTPDEIGWGVRALRAPEVWARQPAVTGTGVRVAVLDSGVDARHPQLLGRVAPGLDVYGGRGRDDCGHGTAVAGVIGAAHDGTEIAGVAPDVTIVPVKVLRYEELFGACVGDDETIAQGIRWAADPAGGRADIINLSLSGPPPSSVLADAVAYAAARGVIVVAAAGNAGDRVPNYPAAYLEVISVGALQPAAGTSGGVEWWPMSSFGSVDIAAPGSAVPIILPDGVTAQRVGAARCPTGHPQPLCADGTSFAAPHVAAFAALLRQVHPEVATLSAPERLTRLRQWILGTATDVAPTARDGGVDLRTGHGQPDAVNAVTNSADEDAVLLTWEVGERILSPTPRMTAITASLPAALVVTTGTGRPVTRRPVTFQPAAGGGLSVTEAITDGGGRAATVFSSTAAGRRTTLTAAIDGRTLPLESYVLQHDDNIPGVALPPSPFRGDLDVVYDVDDVYRLRLKAGETVRVKVAGVDPPLEYIDMYVHSAGAHDVTNPEHAPLREDTRALEMDPRRLRRTMRGDGVVYVHVLGFGTYRARWSILSPGKVRRAAVTPSVFTPDGDGRADTARITWHSARRGQVTLRIRNRSGRVVRSVDLGRLKRGAQRYVWDGRTDRRRVAPAGVYQARVHWTNGRGRVAKTSAKVRLSR